MKINIKKYINQVITAFITVIMFITVVSCSDYLDQAPNSAMSEEDVFTDPARLRRFVNDTYSFLCWYSGSAEYGTCSYGGLGRVGLASFDAITDLAKCTNPSTPTSPWAMGDWTDSKTGVKQELIHPYTNGYAAIRKCNRILANIHLCEGLTDEVRNNYIGQALFFRAFFHFEMIKRYGGVPYVDKILSIDENLDLPRDTYDFCVEKILTDLQRIIDEQLLPVKQADADLGRPTLGAAMAYKARVLLYYASPLNNENWQTDNTRWRAAAQAAYDLISKNYYGLIKTRSAWGLQFFGAENSERIFQRMEDKIALENGGNRYRFWADFCLYHSAPGIGVRQQGGGTYPTQNFIDMFEMADGTPPIQLGAEYDGLNPGINPASGYSDATMYENRDPRFYLTVAYDGIPTWFGPTPGNDTIDVYESDEKQPGVEAQHTSPNRYNVGYITRKMWPKEFSGVTPGTQVIMPWVFFRYTEIWLIYAEAANEAFGPDVDGLGVGLTARQALNEIRNRFFIETNINRDVQATTKEELRERIMNENAVEFFLEEHRWWDVCRWKMGVETFNKPIYRIRVKRKADGTKELIRDRIETHKFADYMHRYPLPKSEVEKSKGILIQNTGWEVTQ
ncbi:MAG: RagB/SusD family nutrient uptake outer membrane protein [Candidatus Symbiothrix sp.]|nr:RagB/SusD family nutrient uptake outer membrane protein [Candidatus Symbiothrix sp.]